MGSSIPATHIAGLDLLVGGRYQRQLCAWCGFELINVDLTLVAVALEPDGSARPPSMWEVGRLIHTDGAVSYTLPEGTDLPADFCGQATLTPEAIGG